jgi:hypothetical protein
MNRKERRAGGDKGKKGDKAVVHNAIDLARQLKERREFAEAFKLYKQILEYDPDNIIALFDLAIDDVGRSRTKLAEARLAKILRQEPKHTGALTCMGFVRLDQGYREEALRYAEKALRHNPDHAIMLQLSNLYRDAGMLERAKELLYKSLEMKPTDVGVWYMLQNLTKYTPDDVARLRELAKKELSLKEKIVLEFTLGRACMDTGQPDVAFWHFRDGNLHRRTSYKYDVRLHEAYVDSIIDLFDEKTVARLRGKASCKSNMPIFVVGLPRSGSTLVDQILSSHPDVGSVGEARFMSQCIPVFENKEVPAFIAPGKPSITRELVERMDGNMLDTIAERYLAEMQPYAHGSTRVVDKMLFNYLWVGVMRLAMPEAKIVHCMRDPVDIGLSIWQINFSDEIPWAYDQKEIGRYYRAYEKLMAHWRKLFPGEFYDIRYEDVVADQEGQSRKLLEFCGLPWNDQVLKFHETTRQVKTASVTQVRKPIYKDSVKKWKKYEKHLTAMIEAMGVTE